MFQLLVNYKAKPHLNIHFTTYPKPAQNPVYSFYITNRFVNHSHAKRYFNYSCDCLHYTVHGPCFHRALSGLMIFYQVIFQARENPSPFLLLGP